MSGKAKCRILKEIRRRIAEENDIPYVTRECRFQGECTGTCPRCESELRYLEQQLALRQSLGKRVAVAALCAGMALSAAGCAPHRQSGGNNGTQLSGEIAYVENEPTPGPEIYVETGEVAWPEETEDPVDSELPGAIALPEETPAPVEIMGDLAYTVPQENHG